MEGARSHPTLRALPPRPRRWLGGRSAGHRGGSGGAGGCRRGVRRGQPVPQAGDGAGGCLRRVSGGGAAVREIQYREAVREALREELLRDPAVVLIGEELIDPWGGTFGVTKGLSTEFGEERIRNTPISESAIIGCAVGAALAGMRPVAEIMFFDFIATGMDQAVNQAAKIRYMS